jgi:phage-related tail fiber protein
MKKIMSLILSLALLVSGVSALAEGQNETALSKIDMTQWQYNAENDVYWQVGLAYAATPADSSYETMGIFVPGAYFTGSDNGDGTWTCSVNESGSVGQYTALTAPLILPVNTPGYSAMAAPEGYDSSMGYGSVSDYTSAGMIILFAGARRALLSAQAETAACMIPI